MKAILEFFSASSLEIVGYTLLHSLWQGLLITIVVTVLLRAIPTKFSNIRYVITTAGLFSMLVCSVVTFLIVSSGSPEASVISGHYQLPSNASVAFVESPLPLAPFFTGTQSFVEKCMPIFLMTWVAGALVFVSRIFIGLAYVDRLRQGSVPVANEWKNYIDKISDRLKIERLITLAESAAIDAPIVIGYIKPFILIPMGMCSSLSTTQLETILIHELMHIRRKDYIVNLVQAFVEAIYFFNPFVWTISNMVKSEREHCCDDAVIDLHGNTTAYATALAALEEARLSGTALSLSLRGSKNELLTRIQRLMEKSAHHHYGSGKLIPAVLLVIGLLCASWISTTRGPSDHDTDYSHNPTVVQDTTKKNKKTRASKKEQKNRLSTQNREVEIDEQVDVDRNIDVDEPVEAEVEENLSSAPPLPDFDLPPIPDVANMIPPLADFDMLLKDLEALPYELHDNDWEKFSQEFEEKFRAKFGDFYEKNQEDIQEMMNEIQQNLDGKFGKDFEAKMQDFAEKQEQWARTHAEKLAQQTEKMALQGEHFEKLGEDMHRFSENFHEDFEKNHREFEKQHKEFEEKSKNFESALREELEKDGYLDKGEKLESIQFNNDALKINGEPIKAEHQGKYNELRKTYFGNGGFIKTE